MPRRGYSSLSDILLDTCAVIWLANKLPMSSESRSTIRLSQLRVSPISVWEIGNLVRKKRISLATQPAVWFRIAMSQMEAVLTKLDVDILADSCALPGKPPNDPADRIIIATARENDMTIVTRDRLILDYAGAGHVRAMAC